MSAKRNVRDPERHPVAVTVASLTFLAVSIGAAANIIPPLVRAPGSINTFPPPPPPPPESDFTHAYNSCDLGNPRITKNEKGLAIIAMDFTINRDPQVAGREGKTFRYGSAPVASRIVDASVRPAQTEILSDTQFKYAIPSHDQNTSEATLTIAEADLERWGPTQYRFVVEAYDINQKRKHQLSCGVLEASGNTYEGISIGQGNAIPGMPEGQIIPLR